MVVLGFGEPGWAAVLRETGPELAVAVMAEVPTIRQLVLSTDGSVLVAAGTSRHPDRYRTAWNVTEALSELWGGLVDDSVGLRVIVDSLQVDVPGAYFGEQVRDRRRWAVLSTSMLVHGSVHDEGSVGLFGDQGARHPR